MEQKTVHPADIKASLEKCGYRPAMVARDLKVSKGTVSRVIAGKNKSKRIAKRISEALGTPVSVLWPGKYSDTPAARRKRAKRVA
jgi:lambda repressor-like predicted transcriptional regulator